MGPRHLLEKPAARKAGSVLNGENLARIYSKSNKILEILDIAEIRLSACALTISL